MGGPGEGIPSWLLPLPRLLDSTSSEESLHVAEGEDAQLDVAELEDLVHLDAHTAHT